MELEILKYPDSRLKQKSEPISDITPEIRELADSMAKAMYESDGIGLAAPQVGRFVRLITVDLSGPSEREALRIYINPELTPLPEPESGEFEMIESEEGCLSVSDYRSNVARYARIMLKALDLDGNTIEREATELEAICLQHECDHLDGKLFIDRISRLKRNLYDSKLKKRLREQSRDE